MKSEICRNLVIICVFIGFDILTGLLKSFSQGSYESSKMRAGLFHKLGELIAFALCVTVDVFAPQLEIVIPFKLSGAVTVYIALMEIGSIVENIGIMNPDIGKYLTGIFEKVREREEK